MSKIENICGFNIEWLTQLDHAGIKNRLANGQIDGVGLNPYDGWSAKECPVGLHLLKLKALAVPFADSVGFPCSDLELFDTLRFIWIAGTKAALRIRHPSLQVLRLELGGRVDFSELKSLSELYLRKVKPVVVDLVSKAAPNLVKLELSRANLQGVSLGALSEVRVIDLYGCKGGGADLLDSNTKIEHLSLESVANPWAILKAMRCRDSLRCLVIDNCGEIPDLSFIEGMKLERLVLMRTKVLRLDEHILDSVQSVVR